MKYIWVTTLVVAFAAGCGEQGGRSPRHYREISISAPSRAERMADVAAMAQAQPNPAPSSPAMDRNMPGAPAVAAAPVSVSWTTPDGWIEQPGKPMRIMTFLVGPDRVECTLTAFPGSVGGIEGNLARWAGQINLALPADALARFARSPTTFETEGGFPCLVYDFADVAPDADPSMLASILPLDDRTLFVKLVGPRALLVEQKDAFTAFSRSLRP